MIGTMTLRSLSDGDNSRVVLKSAIFVSTLSAKVWKWTEHRHPQPEWNSVSTEEHPHFLR